MMPWHQKSLDTSDAVASYSRQMATLETNATVTQPERKLVTIQLPVPEETSRRLAMIAAGLGLNRSEALVKIINEADIPEPPRAA